MEHQNHAQEDHDALITLIEQVKQVRNDIQTFKLEVKIELKEIKDNTTNRVDALEKEKFDSSEARQMKQEIMSLSRWRYIMIGIGITLQFLVPYIMYQILK